MFDLLRTIKEILLGFFDAVGTFIEWVGELLSDIADVIVASGKAVINVSAWLAGLLPAPVLALFMSIIGAVVVYKILGREG